VRGTPASTRQQPAGSRPQGGAECSDSAAAWMRLVSSARTRAHGAMLAGTRQRARRAATRGRGAGPQKTPRRREPEHTAGASSPVFLWQS
jgi:hypothetical protein